MFPAIPTVLPKKTVQVFYIHWTHGSDYLQLGTGSTRFDLEALGLLEALCRSDEHPTKLGPVVAGAQQRPKHDIASVNLFNEGAQPKGSE